MPETLNEELHGYYLEDLSVGMTAAYARTVTEADIGLFAGVSGDDNPVHINQEFAAGTLFGGRIAHGILTASYISTVVGTKLPGPGCIYMKQSLSFKAPVRAGDTVLARATIEAIDQDRQSVTLRCACTVGEKTVLTGEAVMRVDRRPG